LGKQYIDIKVDASMYLNRPIKKNSEIEISKDGNLFIYNNGRSKIKIIWRFYWPFLVIGILSFIRFLFQK
jgi:hypothetical protein